ncbi:MAG: hypothetical protein ACOYY2_03995 [Actinomycetota bacterium]
MSEHEVMRLAYAAALGLPETATAERVLTAVATWAAGLPDATEALGAVAAIAADLGLHDHVLAAVDRWGASLTSHPG